MFVFFIHLCELLALTLSLVYLHPLPPRSVSKSTVYTENVWLGGGGGCWVLLESIFCRGLTLCIWPDSEPTKLLDHHKQKPRMGGILRKINTCREVPFQVNFFRWRHFALLSIGLIFLWHPPFHSYILHHRIIVFRKQNKNTKRKNTLCRSSAGWGSLSSSLGNYTGNLKHLSNAQNLGFNVKLTSHKQ